MNKPKIYSLPAAFVSDKGYVAQMVKLSDYEDLAFALDQERAAHAALRAIVKKQPNASEIIGQAHDFAVKLGWVS